MVSTKVSSTFKHYRVKTPSAKTPASPPIDTVMPIAPEDLLVLDAAAPLPDFEPEAPAPVPVGLTDPVAEAVAESN